MPLSLSSGQSWRIYDVHHRWYRIPESRSGSGIQTREVGAGVVGGRLSCQLSLSIRVNFQEVDSDREVGRVRQFGGMHG